MLTTDELDAMLAKIKAYEAAAPGDWMRKVVLLADTPDTGGDDVLLDSTATDTSGNYRFTGLVAGDYFAISGHYDFVFQVYTLLGDPASVIQRTGSP